MRAFLALEVAEETLIRGLIDAQAGLRLTQADLAIVEKQNLHFTVKFLGEISEAQIPEIDERLEPLELRAADLSVRGIGTFPDVSKPRVVWAGVPRDQHPLIVPLAKAVIAALDGIGESDEREYHPHITLARVRSGRNRDRLASFVQANAARDFGRAHVAVLKLKSSTLTPRGPVYSDVREYTLDQ